jgi:amidase
MSEWGALATTVADAALMLAVLAGSAGPGAEAEADPEIHLEADPDGAAPVRPPDRGLTIAVSTRPPAAGVRLDPAIKLATTEIAKALAVAGHTVADADPPIRQTDAPTVIRQIFAGAAETAAGLPADRLEPRTRRQVRAGRLVRGYASRAKLDATRARVDAWFTGRDLLLTPITATPPPRVGAHGSHGLARTLLKATRFMAFTPPWNLVSYPTVAVPAGTTADGLPFAVQLVAPRGGEPLLLAVARQLEQLRPWRRHAPLASAGEAPVAP